MTGYDPADPGLFHGGDYRGLTGDCAKPTRGLARIKALGFTAVWLPAPVKQKTVQGSSAAYHGEWGLDFTTVDPHLGTEADFAAFVDCAHKLGLRVYLDVQVNNTADVITPTGGTSWVGPGDKPYRDCNGRIFDPNVYVFGLRFPCLKAASMPRPPSVPPADKDVKKPEWLNDVRGYHNRGDVDGPSCSELCTEQGDLGGLDDLFTEQPTVARSLGDIHAAWIKKYKVDGFHVRDARTSIRTSSPSGCRRSAPPPSAAGVKDFELFGDVPAVKAGLGRAVRPRTRLAEHGRPPLQEALVGFVSGRVGAGGIAARLADDDYFLGPAGLAHTPPTFLGNDVLRRGASLIASRSRTGGDVLLHRVLLGQDLLYLLRGAPVVLYGDEVGLMGGAGVKARQDLFPTKVRAWQTEQRVAGKPIRKGTSFAVTTVPVGIRLAKLGALRDSQPALSTGALVVRRAARNVLAFSRIDAASAHELVAVFNAGTTARKITIRTATPSSAWKSLLGTARATTTAKGDLTLTMPPLSTALVRAEAAIPAAKPVAPILRAVPDGQTELTRLDATPGGSRIVSVAFAVKGGRTGWRRLATDDSFPYRAFLDPKGYKRGEVVHVVAIARGLNGELAVSPVLQVALS